MTGKSAKMEPCNYCKNLTDYSHMKAMKKIKKVKKLNICKKCWSNLPSRTAWKQA